MVLIMENLWKKIERLTPFFILSLVIFLLLIGSDISILLFYALLIFTGISLLIYIYRRKKKHQKISGLFLFVCIFLTIFGLLDFTSQLLKIFMKDQINDLDSLPYKIHVYDNFLEALTGFLFGLVLISKRTITEMGWLRNGATDKKTARLLKINKIIGVLVILMSFVLVAWTIYIYFILIPDLQH